MTSCSFRGLVAPMMATALVLLACGPADAVTRPRDSDGAAARAGPKTLVMAAQKEPGFLVMYGRVGTATAGPARYFLWHGNLTEYDSTGTSTASAAVKIPSVQDGDWKVNPDNTMEVTWRIRPDAYWHDGTPLTAKDFVFGYEVILNPALTVEAVEQVKNDITGVRAVDEKTVVINWKALNVNANVNNRDWIPAIASHIVEPKYRSMDPVAFEALPDWRGEFMGLGPYRVTRWEEGSHVESAAFDQYFLGRPKIDRVILKFLPDANVMVANILSGAIDGAGPESMMKPEQIIQIRRGWGPNKGYAETITTMIRNVKLILRPEGNTWTASNAPWTTDKRFRQGMMYAMNRTELIEQLHYGLAKEAPYFLFPEDPLRPLAEQRGYPKYEYDPNRARQLFAEAGWTKGPDGRLQSSAGEKIAPFLCCFWEDEDTNDAREGEAWGQYWKTLGMETQNFFPRPKVALGASATDKRKAELTAHNGRISNWYFNTRENWENLRLSAIPREETKWTGANIQGYVNETYDRLATQRLVTLPTTERREIELQLLKFITEDLPGLNAYYNPLGIAYREGIRGPALPPVMNLSANWNIHTWEMD